MNAAAELVRTLSRAQARELVRAKLKTDDEWLVRALMAIFARQTEDERTAEYTKHLNDRGFTGQDAPLLTSFAKQWQERKWLSDKQMSVLRKRMLKYAGQLMRMVKGID